MFLWLEDLTIESEVCFTERLMCESLCEISGVLFFFLSTANKRLLYREK